VSGSLTEAQLSTANILIECLMLRDNLLSLSVDFLRQDIVDFTSVCGVAFILFFYFTFTSLLCHCFYIALSILSVLYCVYDFIINK